MTDEQESTEQPKPTKWIVLSLIRHGQSLNNVEGCSAHLEEDDPLTEEGEDQAKELGKEWKNVHIDALYSSTLQRAYNTALQISAQSEAHVNLEVKQSPVLVERKQGEEVLRLARSGRRVQANNVFMGLSARETGPTPRGYRPPDGGESPDDVANRAGIALLLLLFEHGKDLHEPPAAFTDKMTIDSPNTLPEGIPHVVVVSHNIFLSELYEKMLCWNTPHRMSTCDYSNTAWSRHVVMYDGDTGRLEFSDMRLPFKFDWYMGY